MYPFLHQQTSNVASFCLETLKLNGSIPIVSGSVIEYPNDTLTSIVGVTVGRHNVLFAGTAKGYLHKVLLLL